MSWEAFAEARGGTLRHRSSWLGDQAPMIDLLVDPCLVRIDPEPKDGAPGNVVVIARFACGEAPRFDVRPLARYSFQRKIDDLVGARDVPLGAPTFDEPFSVDTREAEATRFVWSEDARARMLRLMTATARSDGKTVTVQCVEPVALGPSLDAMIDLAVALGGSGAPACARSPRAQTDASSRPEARSTSPSSPRR